MQVTSSLPVWSSDGTYAILQAYSSKGLHAIVLRIGQLALARAH